jgi:hypothetical protein
MQELSNFVPTFSHRLKPLMRDGSQFTRMLFHPRIDGGIPLDSAIESQQFRSHRRSAFCNPELYHPQFMEMSLEERKPNYIRYLPKTRQTADSTSPQQDQRFNTTASRHLFIARAYLRNGALT